MLFSTHSFAPPALGLGKVGKVSRTPLNQLIIEWDGFSDTLPKTQVTLTGSPEQIEICERYALLSMTSASILLGLPTPPSRQQEPRYIAMQQNDACSVTTNEAFDTK
jgi:hypothetical protein